MHKNGRRSPVSLGCRPENVEKFKNVDNYTAALLPALVYRFPQPIHGYAAFVIPRIEPNFVFTAFSTRFSVFPS
jgi:hypothetical protein